MSTFQLARVEDISKLGEGANNYEKNWCEAQPKSTKSILPPLPTIFFTFNIIVVPRTDIFHIILPLSPTLKYSLHAPAEKSQFFSKYDLPIKVFDYDCVML